jgi:hypothetical protein
MSQPGETVSTLTHEQLPRLHSLTAEVQKICRAQLRAYLDALAPLFRPRRALGDRMEGAGKESVVSADQTYAELREMYFKACGRPFDLRKELPNPLESVGTQIGMYEWEYLYEIRTDRESRSITVVSPLTWVLIYPSTYSLSMLRQVMAGKQERDADGVRSFVLRSCLMHLQFMKLPDLKAVFEGLRYQVEVRKSPQLGELPLVTVSAPVRTVRPANELLLAATGLSGRTGFEEVIDEYQAAHIADPLQAQILKVLDAGNARESVG